MAEAPGPEKASWVRAEREAAIADLSRAGNLAEAVYELALARLDLFIEAKSAARAEPASGGTSAAASLARQRQLAAADDLEHPVA